MDSQARDPQLYPSQPLSTTRYQYTQPDTAPPHIPRMCSSSWFLKLSNIKLWYIKRNLSLYLKLQYDFFGNLYISAPEQRSKMRIAPLDRARKSSFFYVFCDILLQYEIFLPHLQPKHWNLQHPKIANQILRLKTIRRFSGPNYRQLWGFLVIFWTNLRVNLSHNTVSPMIVKCLIYWTSWYSLKGEFDWQFLGLVDFNIFAGGMVEKFHIAAKYQKRHKNKWRRVTISLRTGGQGQPTPIHTQCPTNPPPNTDTYTKSF